MAQNVGKKANGQDDFNFLKRKHQDSEQPRFFPYFDQKSLGSLRNNHGWILGQANPMPVLPLMPKGLTNGEVQIREDFSKTIKGFREGRHYANKHSGFGCEYGLHVNDFNELDSIIEKELSEDDEMELEENAYQSPPKHPHQGSAAFGTPREAGESSKVLQFGRVLNSNEVAERDGAIQRRFGSFHDHFAPLLAQTGLLHRPDGPPQRSGTFHRPSVPFRRSPTPQSSPNKLAERPGTSASFQQRANSAPPQHYEDFIDENKENISPIPDFSAQRGRKRLAPAEDCTQNGQKRPKAMEIELMDSESQ